MNGQTIMQLTSSSIPATIQLTPQTPMATNNQFQTVNTMQPQLLQQQPTLPTLSTLPPPSAPQPQKPKVTPPKVKITSQQIIKSAIPIKSPEIVLEEKNRKPKNYAEKIMQQVQQHKQQLHTASNTMPTTPAGLTVQRISKQATKTNKPQTTNEEQRNTVSSPKIPLLNVNNVTISRVSTQQQQRKQPDNNAKQNQQQTTTLRETTTRVSPVKKVLNKMLPTKRTTETKLAIKDTATTKTLSSCDETKLSTQNKTVTDIEKPKTSNANIKLETIENTTRPTMPSKPAVIKCDQCGRNFKKKEHLTQHVKLHAGIRPFKCTQTGCEKTFSRKEHLLRHLISHTGKKMFSCDLCNKPFSRKDNLNKHRRIHSMQVQEENYKCEICDKTFIPKAYYEQHMQTHNKVQKEKCNNSANELSKEVAVAKSQSQTHHQQQQQMQQRQPQAQQNIMHLQLPSNVVGTNQNGGTITITQTSNHNNNNQTNINHHDATVLKLPVSLGNYVQLTPTQFVNTATGQIINKI